MKEGVKKPGESDGAPEFNPDGTPVVRVRLPKKRNGEQFACAELMMGANHIRVRCLDGVERMGRIKGKIKKRAWIREGDILIVVPWSFQDEKCDILYRYLPPQADWLRKNHYLSV
ncbi:translation initiation factor eIF-1A [Methanoregula sp.]|uniref:translation initiation factor eIF-1A n=1 Tax=Methanoregula sp. TaxID=2052170 RepID=UPI003C74A6DC